MTTRTVATWIAALTATLTAGAALAGCGTSTSPATTTPAPSAGATAPSTQAHNQADITFAAAMIPHHAQAVAMSDIAAQRAQSPQVKALASRIQAAQQPEIDQMSAFLRSWNAPVPSATDSGMGPMNHGGTSPTSGAQIHGMMSGAQMQQLGQANAAAFDRMFLQMMISHHQGAVNMAQTELRDGQNTEAKALAQKIIDAQQREIAEMQALLSTM